MSGCPPNSPAGLARQRPTHLTGLCLAGALGLVLATEVLAIEVLAIEVLAIEPASAGQPLQLLPPDLAGASGGVKPGQVGVPALPAPGVSPTLDQPFGAAPARLQPPANQVPGNQVPGDQPIGNDAIRIDELGATGTDGTGTLSEGEGGFGQDMWQGLDRTSLADLIARLPAGSPSPRLAALERRLLLSDAAVPAPADLAAQADAGGTTAPPAGPNLMAERAERLIAMGRPEDAQGLTALAPKPVEDPALVAAMADAALAVGNDEVACGILAETPPAARAASAVQKLAIFCALKAGKRDEAMLGIDLLHEEKGDDGAFSSLVGLMDGGSAKVQLPNPPPALDLAMVSAAGKPLGPALGKARSPAALSALARDPRASAEGRLAAGEKAVSLGGMSPGGLAELYQAVTVPSGNLEGSAPGGAKGRAALFQGVLAADDPQSKIDRSAKLLASARTDGVEVAAAEVLLPILLQVPPDPSLAEGAPVIARSLYLIGAAGPARDWAALAEPGEPGDLALLARLSGGTQEFDWSAAMARWLASGKAQEAGSRAARLAALGAALGESVSPGASLVGATTAGSSHEAAIAAIGQAAAGHQLGLTVGLILIELGSGGVGEADSASLAAAIAALRDLGLEEDARALAVEAALAASR